MKNNIIICISCRSAIAWNSLSYHLQRSQYHHFDVKTFRSLLAPFENLPIARTPDEIRPLPDGSSPHPDFPIYDGFRCLQCPFKTINQKAMRIHCINAHRLSGIYGTLVMQQQQRDDRFQATKLQCWHNFQHKMYDYWTIAIESPSSPAESAATLVPTTESIRRKGGKKMTNTEESVIKELEQDLKHLHEEEEQWIVEGQQQFEQVKLDD
jgi:hypothetical protein